ncbi:uncharacterized protein TNCV_4939911 [Trichonephila clavipes]|nr:uncharacterized protein TNCV_4939911 [Trichonephila clavipes]
MPLTLDPTKFNLYDPEVRGTNGFSVLPEVYFSESENVNEFLDGIHNQIQLLEIPSDILCAYLKGHLLRKAPRLVSDIRVNELLSKFEERYSCKALRGSGNSDNVERRGWNVRRTSNADDSWRNWRNSEVLHRPNKGRNDYKGNYENDHQGNQWFDNKNRFQKDGRRFNDRGY